MSSKRLKDDQRLFHNNCFQFFGNSRQTETWHFSFWVSVLVSPISTCHTKRRPRITAKRARIPSFPISFGSDNLLVSTQPACTTMLINRVRFLIKYFLKQTCTEKGCRTIFFVTDSDSARILLESALVTCYPSRLLPAVSCRAWVSNPVCVWPTPDTPGVWQTATR